MIACDRLDGLRERRRLSRWFSLGTTSTEKSSPRALRTVRLDHTAKKNVAKMSLLGTTSKRRSALSALRAANQEEWSENV